MHYPFISRKYLIQVEKKQYALLNPYCFTSFFNDVVSTDANMMISISKWREFSAKKIEENIQQLGSMVLALLDKSFDEDRINYDSHYRV